jgi:hypothetical protein
MNLLATVANFILPGIFKEVDKAIPDQVSLPTPPDLWALIKLGLGGYVVGRSAEKCVTAWKN